MNDRRRAMAGNHGGRVEDAVVNDRSPARPEGQQERADGPLVVPRNDTDTDEVFRVVASGFHEAVRILEGTNDRRPIGKLIVYDAEESFVRTSARAFPRFVTLLRERRRERERGREEEEQHGEQHGGGGGSRTVRGIVFMCDWSEMVLVRDDDMERLFRDVLPGHRTLQEVSIYLCHLPARFVQLLTENIPASRDPSSHFKLYVGALVGMEIDATCRAQVAQAIADMLHRNPAITFLRVQLDLEPDQTFRICQALRHSTNLRHLILDTKMLRADSLEGVGASSSLQLLCVTGVLHEDAVASLLRQLRTNETLRTLRLSDYGDDGQFGDPQALLELVSTYNFTLGQLVGNYLGLQRITAPLREYLRRNGRIRDAFEQLIRQDLDPHARPELRAVPVPRLPQLLGLVSDVPTALYRILRMGYVHVVSDLLRSAQQHREDGHH